MILWQIIRSYCVELATVLFLISARAWRFHRLRRSILWPVSDGVPSKIVSEQRGTKLALKIFYSYRVYDEPNPLVGKFEKYFSVANEAQLWAAALRQQTLIVHYNPKKHWQSVLWESELNAAVRSQKTNFS
jgi:hypothetical protein